MCFFLCFQKANSGSATILREYLQEKKLDTKFEEFSAPELNAALELFYINIRSKEGEIYKTSSLDAIRYGLNRYLKAPPLNKKFDLLKSPEFTSSNEAFKVAKKEAKSEGKGETDSYPPIDHDDLEKLYTNLHMNPNTPSGLSNKVQFDIRLHFCRRGGENMVNMSPSMFEIIEDDKGKYVKKRGELTKNHREASKSGGEGVMAATGTKSCPVASFQKYTAKLNKSLPQRMWQYPKDQFNEEDDEWYYAKPIGKNTLSKFMSNMSAKCNLSHNYTNHSIRSTNITMLSELYQVRDVMTNSGHRSYDGIKSYQKTTLNRKRKMSLSLSSRMDQQRPKRACPSTVTSEVLSTGPAPEPSSSSRSSTPCTQQLSQQVIQQQKEPLSDASNIMKSWQINGPVTITINNFYGKKE